MDLKINSNVMLPDAGIGANPKNVICFANEARFETSTYSSPLTEYVVGFKVPGVEESLKFVAPDTPTAKRFEFKRFGENDQFLTEIDDQRAIGSAFKKVEYSGTSESSRTFNKGLTITIDHDDVIGSDWEMRVAGYLKKRLWLNELMRAMSILSAGATNVAKTWSSGDSVDPDGDMEKQVDLGGDDTGLDPNRMIVGKSPWLTRKGHYRLANTPYAGHAVGFSVNDLADQLGLDAGMMIKHRYQFNKTTKKKVLGTIIFYMAEDGLLKDDPSSIKRFVSPCEDGSQMRVYIEKKMKTTDITVEHYSNIVLPVTKGIRMLTIS